MRIWFVINPAAGRVQVSGLAERLGREFPNDELQIVDAPPDRERITADTAEARVVAVGGDGTIQRVLSALGDPIPCPVGILPLGTSNDLARATGIPLGLRAACAVLRNEQARRIDLMEVNGIPFATAGGIGLPTAIAARADRLRTGRGFGGRIARRLGRAVYVVAAALEAAGRWCPVSGRLDAAAGGPTTRWAAVMVSNQPSTGGFCASPEADARDGELDLCAIAAPSGRLRLAWIMLRAIFGQAASCPEVSAARRRAMTLVTPRPVPFLGDGEILLRAERFEIRVRPRALPLVCPLPVTASAAGYSHD